MENHKFVAACFAIWLGTFAYAQESEQLNDSFDFERVESDLGSDWSLSWPRSIGAIPKAIVVSPLETSQPDAVGLLTSRQTGIAQGFWGESNPNVIARLIAPYYNTAIPEITALWQRIALTEIDAPQRSTAPREILLARIEHLLNAGSLDQAEALINRAGSDTPALFNHAFDVGLLTGRTHSACATMLRKPALTPGLKARVFCLARENDWSAAALTLASAEALGQISTADGDLLARFLDPELFDESNPPPAPVPLTALDFTLREALALPRTGQALPLAFLHADMENQTGWRNRVIATERLVRSQAVPSAKLIDLYKENKPAASGGVWARVSAVQNLLAAVESTDSARISDALNVAHKELKKAGLAFVLVDLATNDLRHTALSDSASSLRFRLWLLHPDYRNLSNGYVPQNKTETFLLALAQGGIPDAAHSDIEAGIRAAYLGASLTNSSIYDARKNRIGEAVLKSLTALVHTHHGDPVAVETAIDTLLVAGLEDEARRIAMQVVMNQQGKI